MGLKDDGEQSEEESDDDNDNDSEEEEKSLREYNKPTSSKSVIKNTASNKVFIDDSEESSEEEEDEEDEPDSNSISISNNNFSFDLYKEVAKEQGSKSKNKFIINNLITSLLDSSNLFYSPYSIFVALSICKAGSRKNTELQLKKVLSYKNLSNDEIHKANLELHNHLNSLSDQISLNIGNKIFQRNSFKINKEFIDLLKKFYNSDAQGLDFSNPAASAKVINDWVATQTNNKIQNLVPETVITDLTKLILVNAIYFKG
jgi:serine protease inhibitor